MKAQKYIKLKPGDCYVHDKTPEQYKVIEAIEECSEDVYNFLVLDCFVKEDIGNIITGIPGELPHELGWKRTSKEELADYEVNIEFTL